MKLALFDQNFEWFSLPNNPFGSLGLEGLATLAAERTRVSKRGPEQWKKIIYSALVFMRLGDYYRSILGAAIEEYCHSTGDDPTTWYQSFNERCPLNEMGTPPGNEIRTWKAATHPWFELETNHFKDIKELEVFLGEKFNRHPSVVATSFRSEFYSGEVRAQTLNLVIDQILKTHNEKTARHLIELWIVTATWGIRKELKITVNLPWDVEDAA